MTGNAHGRRANGSMTLTANTTHLWSHFPTV